MGCGTSTTQPSFRESIFLEKASNLINQFSDLKRVLIKTQTSIYERLSIKKRILENLKSKERPKDIEIALTQDQQIIQQLKINGLIQDTVKIGDFNLQNNTKNAKFNISNQGKVENIYVEKNSPILQNIECNQQNPLAPENPLSNQEEFIFIDSSIEKQYLRDIYEKYMLTHINGQKVCELCYSLLRQLEQNLNYLSEFYKQTDILLKCIHAFKDEIRNKGKSAIYGELKQVLVNSSKISEQLKRTKENINQLSLMTIISDTSDSLVNDFSPIAMEEQF